VLYVDDIKHNLLTVIQIFYQGDNVLFHSKTCKVMDANTWKIVVKEVKSLGNVYVLEEGNEKCFIGKNDER
jgi:hypothetical protein